MALALALALENRERTTAKSIKNYHKLAETVSQKMLHKPLGNISSFEQLEINSSAGLRHISTLGHHQLG